MEVDIKDFNHLNLHKITKPKNFNQNRNKQSFHKTHFNNVKFSTASDEGR